MPETHGTYDTQAAQDISLQTLISLFSDLGVDKIYTKHLASNDNSKNQIYVGSHLTDLAFIPTGQPVPSATASNKTKDLKRQILYKVPVDLSWVDAEGNVYPAPNAKLIYYPQYPEVRFSGYLLGSKVKISEWMDRYKRGTSPGRWLILGVANSGKVYAYLATSESALSNELHQADFLNVGSVLLQLDTAHTGIIDTRAALLARLSEIHGMGWVPGQRLRGDGHLMHYTAANGGGYTLEALLDIIPNGLSEPDYLGWEVKQYGVSAFPNKGSKPTTLMTPEPDGGYYRVNGASNFVRTFGYPDKSGKEDRLNFGGRHFSNALCKTTNLFMRVEGFDPEAGRITDAEGAITLRNVEDTLAASWSFSKIMDHWKRKHSQAVYVPCLMRASAGGREYFYGNHIELGTGTNFEMFLSATVAKAVYYDPGLKLENASTAKPRVKVRNQFRINHGNLSGLYSRHEIVEV